MVSLLDPASVAHLQAAPFTYDDVGATLDAPPAGWATLRVTRILERRDFEQAAAELLAWQVQEGAGLRVAASSPQVVADAVVRAQIGLGPLRISAPCRVVALIGEPDRAGFVYGTLPRHPVQGEELFALQRLGDGSVRLEVVAFSRPALGAARPLAQRYLHALDRPAR
ncbi:DUF1990 domain-containing protein [Nocardioides sp. TRM66260-LWL]|uniref:DUF1990 family protein n=1 Tax=Nocardioides sp. TRM66260-LWL TaxID=2874478 RepID=UPI001CC65A94|nr:DUF1990 domain-containing protein [Nocardioides sp. TRM66260-LWL]MBZ5733080.1 DUF1990 domain-containing protein [Nocardioides sp. TRM66260-LWL]